MRVTATEQLFRKPVNIRAGDRLLPVGKPLIMGILNITPDSFYDGGMYQSREMVRLRVAQMLENGAAILDIGAASTRPGSVGPAAAAERERLDLALQVIRSDYPRAVVSIDTCRADIAEWAVKEYQADMINDVSGGNADPEMIGTIGRLRVPYILMHMLGTPRSMQNDPKYNDVVRDISLFFAGRIRELAVAGAADIILDPGFGFGKTVEHNYELLSRLAELAILGRPVLIGISRKSMIYKVLNGAPESSLNGTTALNMVSLLAGADILRVHDVKQAMECLALVDKIKNRTA
jgi:dihydropteroate synthase